MRSFLLLSVLTIWAPSTATAQQRPDSLPAETIATQKRSATTLPSEPLAERQTVRAPLSALPRQRYKTPGYRVQIYTGANNRSAKQTALRMKTAVQQHFPELSVYVSFQAPRWICRVGDFLSREEAQAYVKKLRRKRISSEATIVACPVLRPF